MCTSPCPLGPCPFARLLMAPLALCDPSPASHGTLPHGTQASQSMGPCHKRASHACKPFSSPLTPPLCPRLVALGMGAVGPSPSGLRVSSHGLQFFAFPPLFFSEVPCPLCLPGPTSPWPTRFLLARSTYWCWCPIIGADLRPLACNAASPYRHRSPLFGHVAPSLQLFSSGSRAALVMHTGYRASSRTQVVTAFTPFR